MEVDKNIVAEPFEDSTEQSINYAVDRASILGELTGSIIRQPGVFLVTGSPDTGREGFLEDLKQKLILKGCAVFTADHAFNSFSDYVYHCLQQQSYGSHSKMDMLPLKSDGSHLFFDGGQLTVFILDQVNLFTDDVLLEVIQTVISANKEGHQVGLVLADDLLMNDRLEALKHQDSIVSSNIIPALDAVVVRDYIDHTLLLNREKYGDCVFSPGAIREIASLAKGDLNRVNELCRESLILAMKNEDQIVTVHMVKESGSDRFFKLHGHESAAKQSHHERIRSRHPSVNNAGWMGLIFNKMRANAFASTAALVPLILIAFYFKSSLDEQERADALVQRAKLSTAVNNEAAIESATISPDVIDAATSKVGTADSAAITETSARAQVVAGTASGIEQVKNVTLVPALNVDSKTDLSAPPVVADAGIIEALVEIEPAASKPLKVFPQITGDEDSSVLLRIGLGVGHNVMNRYIEISGVPEGATISKGVRRGDIWSIAADQLQGLELIPSADKDHDYQLEVRLKDLSQHTVQAAETIAIEIQAVADKPFMSFSNITGDQYTAIPVEITARLADADGSESLTIEIVGLPETVKISAGDKNDSGVWVLTPKDLDELILTPMEGSPTNLNLLIMAVASEVENSSRAVVSGTLNVSIIPGVR